MRNHRPKICQFCNSAKASNHIKSHERICQFNNLLRNCHLCDYQTCKTVSLILHMKTHNVKKKKEKLPFKCEVCDYICSGKQRFQRHLLVHSAMKYKCDYCKRQFNYLTKLNNHLTRKHMKFGKLEEGADIEYKCDKCDFKSKWKRSHERHKCQVEKKILDPPPPPTCPKCDHIFTKKYSLKRHLKICTAGNSEIFLGL